MKYKNESPQLENGYVRLANELIEAYARTTFSQNEIKCLFVIIRQTYGYNRKTARISCGRIAKMTEILRQNVWRSLKKLKDRKIILRSEKGIGPNKNYSEWK